MPTPLAASVLVCESIIEDKRGILSVISILDVIKVHIPPDFPQERRGIQFKVLAIAKFAPGLIAEGTAELKFTRPSGETSNAGIDPIPFRIPAGDAPGAFNLISEINLVLKEEGLHRVSLVINGDEVAHTIFTLRTQLAPEEAPAETQQ